jgi:hypothetical protein
MCVGRLAQALSVEGVLASWSRPRTFFNFFPLFAVLSFPPGLGGQDRGDGGCPRPSREVGSIDSTKLWSATGPNGVPGDDGAGEGPPLLERSEELARLGWLCDRAAAGYGGAISIIGAAGIGKTELIRAAARTARERGLRVIGARGDEVERLGWGVVRDLFEPVVGDMAGSEAESLFRGAAGLARPLLEGTDRRECPPPPIQPPR